MVPPVRLHSLVLDKSGPDDRTAGAIAIADLRVTVAGAVEMASIACPLPEALGWDIAGQRRGKNAAVAPAAEAAPGGAKAVGLHYHYDGSGNEACDVSFHLKEPFILKQPPARISMQVRGDGKNKPLDLQFLDARNRWHHWYVKHVNWQGWQKVEFDLTVGGPGYAGWGGDGLGKNESPPMQAPVRFLGFVLDKGGPNDKDEGQLDIGDVQFTVPKPDASVPVSARFRSTAPFHVFAPGAEVALTLEIQNGGPVLSEDFSHAAPEIFDLGGWPKNPEYTVVIADDPAVKTGKAATIKAELGPECPFLELQVDRLLGAMPASGRMKLSAEIHGASAKRFANLRLRIHDCHGGVFCYALPQFLSALNGAGWQHVEDSFDQLTPQEVQGGNRNGHIDGPATISFFANCADPKPVEFSLANLVLAPEARAAELTAVCTWIATDLDGKPIASGEAPVSLKDGGTQNLAIRFKPAKPGIFYVNARVVRAGGTEIAVQARTSAAVMNSAERPAPVEPFRWGICTSHLPGAAIFAQKREVELMKLAGYSTVRMGIAWIAIEPQPGVFNWKRTDRLMKLLREAGIEPEVILMGVPGWASLMPQAMSWEAPPRPEAFRNFSKLAAERYKDTVRIWEIHNEPDHTGFWKGTVEQHIEMFNAGYAGVKEGNPQALVMNGGFAWEPEVETFRERTLEFVGKFLRGVSPKPDIYAFHSYRPVPTFLRNNELLMNMIRESGGEGKPIWLNESGAFFSADRERDHASMVLKRMVASQAIGHKAFLDYCLVNTGTDPENPEDNHGLMTNPYVTPKASFVAYRTLIEHLSGKTFVRDLQPGPDNFAYLFADKQEQTLVLWHEKRTDTGHARVLRTAATEARLVDMMGVETPVPLVNGLAVLPVEKDAAFVILRGTDKPAEFVGTDFLALPPAINAAPAGRTKVAITVKNVFGAPLTGKISLSATNDWTPEPATLAVDVPADGSKTLEFTVAAPPAGGAGGAGGRSGTLTAVLETALLPQPLPATAPLNPSLLVPRLPAGVKPGDLTPWKEPLLKLGMANVVNLVTGLPDQSLYILTPEDLSADVFLGLSGDKLILNVRVQDQTHFQKEAPAEMWKGDSLQFAIAAPGGQHYEWLLGLPEGSPPKALLTLAPKDVKTGEFQADCIVRREGTTTLYGIALALDLPGLPEFATHGGGFNLLVNDNDGKLRKGWVQWTDGIGREKNPALFKTVVFVVP